MLSLPRELFINHILTNTELYHTDYDESEDDITIADLEKEYSNGLHCSIWYLYATCKSFKWLENYEYIYLYSNKFEPFINTCNIHGQLHGMRYNYGNYLHGYSKYNQGELIYENMLYNGPHHRIRSINDKVYKNWHKCDHSPDRYRTKCNHEHCLALNEVNGYVRQNDTIVQEIIISHDWEIWGKIFIRIPSKLDVKFIHDKIPEDYKCTSEDEEDILA